MKKAKRKSHIKKRKTEPKVQAVSYVGLEYIVEDFPGEGTTDLEVKLNGFGMDGWLLVTTDGKRFYFVRHSGPQPKE